MTEKKQPNSLFNSISYSDDIYSEDYVAQFLDFTVSYELHCSHQNQKDLFKPSQFIRREDIMLTQIIDEESSDKQDTQKCKSSFHNFQKLLVTTLRNNIDLSQIKFDEQTEGLELMLWNFFLKCPKMTRTLIYLVYGGLSIQGTKVKRFIRQYGLQKIIRCYCEGLVKKAQKNIRQETLSQVKKLDLGWQLGNRRMKNKNEFRIYFEAFVEELKDGGLNKRIPKQKKIKVSRDISKNKQDFQGLSFNKA